MLQLQQKNRRSKTPPRYATSRFCGSGTFYDSGSRTWLYAEGSKKTIHKNEWPRINWDYPGWCKYQGVRGYVSFPMPMQGCFAWFPLYRVKTVRIYCIWNKSPPVAVAVLVNPDFTIQAAGFYYSADVSTEEEIIRFIMLCI